VGKNALLMPEVRGESWPGWFKLIERQQKLKTMHYNQGLQKSISERTTHQALKHVGDSSRRHTSATPVS